MSNVRKIDVPKQSLIYPTTHDANFADAYTITLAKSHPDASALSFWLSNIRKTPAWIDGAMSLRNRVVARLGLKNLGELSAIDLNKAERDCRVGERLGIFTIEHISHDELILGDKDKHLEVSLSLLVENAGQKLTISTVVHEHNWLGRVYMWFVAPMHRIIAPSVLKRFGA